MNVYRSIDMYADMFVYICTRVRIYVYIHAYIHASMHTHKLSLSHTEWCWFLSTVGTQEIDTLDIDTDTTLYVSLSHTHTYAHRCAHVLLRVVRYTRDRRQVDPLEPPSIKTLVFYPFVCQFTYLFPNVWMHMCANIYISGSTGITKY